MFTTDHPDTINILLVDGSILQFGLVRQVLGENRIGGRLHRVGDIVETLAYLRGDEPYIAIPVPDLVLIAQDQSGTCACDVVAETCRNPRLQNLQILVLKDDGRQTSEKDDRSPVEGCCGVTEVEIAQLPQAINGRKVTSPRPAQEMNGR